MTKNQGLIDVKTRALAAAALVLLLSACSAGAPAPQARAAVKKVDPAAVVADVRASGEHGHELEVQPLRDPQVEDLRLQAQTLEAEGKLKPAGAALDQALAITPEDPDLLQWKAELALLRRAWEEAEVLANQSFERGPKLGGLCRRNWSTIAHARENRGASEAAEVARRQVASCTVAPPVRM